MIYPYFCDQCEIEFDVTKSMHDSARPENCLSCGKVARRIYTADVVFSGTSVESAEYNPAFGKVIKNKYHRAEEAKKRGMIEIGNEKVESVHKHFDEVRKDKRKKVWEAD